MLTEYDLLLMAEYIEDVTNSELFSTMLATNIKGRNRLERSHIYLWQMFLSCLGVYLRKKGRDSTVFNKAIGKAVHELPIELGRLLLSVLD